MPLSKIRFVAACQQLLALAVVLVVLTPAASVISLDVAHETPAGGLADAPTTDIGAELRASTRALRRTPAVPDRVTTAGRPRPADLRLAAVRAAPHPPRPFGHVVGPADAIVREKASGYRWLIPGKAAGFGKRRFLTEGMGVYDLAG